MSSPPYDNTPEEVLETQNTPSTASTNKVRKKTSEIWKHFSDHAELPYKVVCNYCGKVFSHALGGGLGHLRRHYEDKHMPKEGGQTDFRQARLQIGSSGNVGNWKFDEKYCRERTVQYIIEDEQAFSLDDIFENMNMSDKTLEFIQKVQDKLNSLFEEYNKYYGTSSSSASASSTTSSHPSKSIFKLLDKKRKDKYEKRGVSNELESYLSCELAFNQDEQDNLDILTWWSNNALRFPVVSRLAKDLLTIPASTVASESAFSAGKRILTDTRNRLSDANVEAAICNKDWYDVVRRLQGLTLDDSSPEDDNSTTPTTDVD